MKSFLLFFALLQFHFQSFAEQKKIENRDLTEFWAAARFINCDGNFIDEIDIRNQKTLNINRLGKCKNADLQDLKNEETITCLKSLNGDLQIYLNYIQKRGEFICEENPKFAEFLSGDKTAIEIEKPVYELSTTCTPLEKSFKLTTENGKNVCFNKYECKSRFKFGKNNILEPGTYHLRCNDKAKTQADCSEMGNYTGCEGNEVSFVKVEWGGLKNSAPTSVKASKAPAAQ
jgi:hypothetical protein